MCSHAHKRTLSRRASPAVLHRTDAGRTRARAAGRRAKNQNSNNRLWATNSAHETARTGLTTYRQYMIYRGSDNLEVLSKFLNTEVARRFWPFCQLLFRVFLHP